MNTARNAAVTLARILRAPGAPWLARDIRGLQSAVGNRAAQRTLSSIGENSSLRRAGATAVLIQRNYDQVVDEAFDSRTSTVRAIARALDSLDWPEAKPRIMFVPGSQIAQTATYDRAAHVIRANIDEHDVLKLWDNVLFQARCALEQQELDRARRLGVADAAADSQSARAADANDEVPVASEFEAFMAYARSLDEAGVPRRSLTSDAVEALERADRFQQLPVDEARAEFAHLPEVPHLLEKAALGPGDLGSYETIEAWGPEQMAAWMRDALAPVIEEFGGPASDTARGLRAIFELAEWPADPAQRPAFLQELIDAAIEQADIEDVKETLRSLRLSDRAAEVAAEAAAGI
ncbi:MAG: hypothetical protein WEB13_04595 [Dehalococcoidia bacterium]